MNKLQIGFFLSSFFSTCVPKQIPAADSIRVALTRTVLPMRCRVAVCLCGRVAVWPCARATWRSFE